MWYEIHCSICVSQKVSEYYSAKLLQKNKTVQLILDLHGRLHSESKNCAIIYSLITIAYMPISRF